MRRAKFENSGSPKITPIVICVGAEIVLDLGRTAGNCRITQLERSKADQIDAPQIMRRHKKKPVSDRIRTCERGAQ